MVGHTATTVHTVFSFVMGGSEHNKLLEDFRGLILGSGDVVWSRLGTDCCILDEEVGLDTVADLRFGSLDVMAFYGAYNGKLTCNLGFECVSGFYA